MVDVKINASFILPGSVLPAELLSARKRGKKEKKEEKEKQDNQILYRQEKIRLPKGQSIVINLREAKPAKQVIHLSLDLKFVIFRSIAHLLLLNLLKTLPAM